MAGYLILFHRKRGVFPLINHPIKTISLLCCFLILIGLISCGGTEPQNQNPIPVDPTMPILCALPYTASFVEDIRSGFLKQYLPRSGKKAYIRGKLIACGLSGGLVLVAGALSLYALAALVFTPMELALGPGEAGQPYFALFLMKAVMLFFFGVFWSLAGFTFAALAMNTYMAYASPFILYYLLIILKERYFENLYVLYPREWLFPSGKWEMGSFGVILLLVELTAVLCLVFAVTAERRLSDG